jgi:hypothetical protein
VGTSETEGQTGSVLNQKPLNVATLFSKPDELKPDELKGRTEQWILVTEPS